MSCSRAAVVAACVCVATLAVGQVRSRTLPASPEAAMASDSNLDRASCVLQIQQDMNTGRMGPDVAALSAMLTSTALVDPAAKKVLGLSGDQWPKVAQVELVNAGQSALKVSITVNRSANAQLPPNAADAFLKELVSRAKAALDTPSAQDQANAQRKEALEKDLAAARAKQAEASEKMRQAQRDAGTDYAGRSSVASMTMEKNSLETALAGQKARLAVLEKEGANRQQPMSPTSAAAELVALREKAVDATVAQQKAGSATDLQVLEAQSRLAEARLLLATTLQTARPGYVNPADDLVSLKASIAESEARLSVINDRLAKAQATPVLDVNALSMDEQRARQQVSDLQQQLDSLTRQWRTGSGPRLIVLDGGAMGAK